jgi:hypothetical protein
MSPSSLQDPTKISSFLSSGPGFGISICATAAEAIAKHAAKIIPARFIRPSSNASLSKYLFRR